MESNYKSNNISRVVFNVDHGDVRTHCTDAVFGTFIGICLVKYERFWHSTSGVIC